MSRKVMLLAAIVALVLAAGASRLSLVAGAPNDSAKGNPGKGPTPAITRTLPAWWISAGDARCTWSARAKDVPP